MAGNSAQFQHKKIIMTLKVTKSLNPEFIFHVEICVDCCVCGVLIKQSNNDNGENNKLFKSKMQY